MRIRPDVILRNKSPEQRLAVSRSWDNPIIRAIRIVGIRNESRFGNKNALGHRLTDEQKARISEAKRGHCGGVNHPNWKGGISPRVLVSFQYKEWRKSVFERDNFTCQMPNCGQRGGDLEAHHIKSWHEYPELRYEVSNGVTLCKDCHNKTKWHEEEFMGVLTFQLP